ncbi:Uncharacterised protein [Mycobacteroides abscessus subsp. abscessus]|nr:Uncharacterised protein [Mycobacteroides abscessus subsp. abscessus]
MSSKFNTFFRQFVEIFYVFINNVNRTCDCTCFWCLRHVADIDSFKWHTCFYQTEETVRFACYNQKTLAIVFTSKDIRCCFINWQNTKFYTWWCCKFQAAFFNVIVHNIIVNDHDT